LYGCSVFHTHGIRSEAFEQPYKTQHSLT